MKQQHGVLADCPKCGQNERKEADVKEWLETPADYPQRIEVDCWCHRCRERYSCALRFDNETGVYYGGEACPFCGHDGMPVDERQGGAS